MAERISDEEFERRVQARVAIKDGMSAANLIAHRAPEGLKVVKAETEHDTVTVTYQLRPGWSWDTVA